MIDKLLFKDELSVQNTVFVACSGGVDSMVLLHLLLQLEFPVAVLHCNFQLRDKDSDDDEIFIREYCKNNKIPCHTKRFETKSYLKNQQQSIQEIARNLRYNWFEEIMALFPNALICTAHHADDNEEQIWLRLLSSGRLLDLSGIPSKRSHFRRPLLHCSKSQIIEYAISNRLIWKEDSSNLKTDYARNKIRLGLKPVLIEIDKRHSSSIQKLSFESDRLRRESTYLLINKIGNSLFKGAFFVEDELWESFLSITKEILLEFWRHSNAQLHEIERFYSQSQPGRQLNFTDGHYLIREKNGLWFGNEVLETFDEVAVDLLQHSSNSQIEKAIRKDFQMFVKEQMNTGVKYGNIQVKKPPLGAIVFQPNGKKRKVKKIFNDEKWTYRNRKMVLGYYSDTQLIAIFPLTRLYIWIKTDENH